MARNVLLIIADDLGTDSLSSTNSIARRGAGRFATLEEVVTHDNPGVKRPPNLDPNLVKHPDAGPGLNDSDQAALVAFLKTLTDAMRKGGGKESGVPVRSISPARH